MVRNVEAGLHLELSAQYNLSVLLSSLIIVLPRFAAASRLPGVLKFPVDHTYVEREAHSCRVDKNEHVSNAEHPAWELRREGDWQCSMI